MADDIQIFFFQQCVQDIEDDRQSGRLIRVTAERACAFDALARISAESQFPGRR